MKLKQRVGDFRVRELLVDGYLQEAGDQRVYRVTKKKLTSLEAARVLAEEAGVEQGDIGIAGMKDRQGVTVQHMSVARGRDVRVSAPELKIETAGFATEPLTSAFSRGNGFELTVRALHRGDIHRLRDSLEAARGFGLVNYFDDQRFGNITHEQGWIAKELMLGRHEEALKRLLARRGPFDAEQERRFKDALNAKWGDWRVCREIAGKFGAHHSIFEHLGRAPEDFAGAFTYVSSRLRLIHLYAFQSHVWNRAVAEHVRALVPVEQRLVIDGLEGPLVTFAGEPPAELASGASFRLPGEGLEDVSDSRQYDFLRDVLAERQMVPDQFRIEGVSGFHVKGEDRPLVVVPRHLRVRPAETDVLNRGLQALRVRFELDRGAYATLVVKRLLATPVGAAERGAERGTVHPVRGERDQGPRQERAPRRPFDGPRHTGGGSRDERDGGQARHAHGGGRSYGGPRDDRSRSRDDRDRGQGGGRSYGGQRENRGWGRDDRDRGQGGGRSYGGPRDDRGRGRDDRDRGQGGGRSYGGPRDDRGRGRDDRDRGQGGGRSHGGPRDDRGRGRDDRDRGQGGRRSHGGQRENRGWGRDDRDRGQGGGRSHGGQRENRGWGRDDRDRGQGGGRSYGGQRDDRGRGRDDRDRGQGGGRSYGGPRDDRGRGRDDRDRGQGGGRSYGGQRENRGWGRDDRDRGQGGGRSYGGQRENRGWGRDDRDRGQGGGRSYGGQRDDRGRGGDDRDRGQGGGRSYGGQRENRGWGRDDRDRGQGGGRSHGGPRDDRGRGRDDRDRGQGGGGRSYGGQGGGGRSYGGQGGGGRSYGGQGSGGRSHGGWRDERGGGRADRGPGGAGRSHGGRRDSRGWGREERDQGRAGGRGRGEGRDEKDARPRANEDQTRP